MPNVMFRRIHGRIVPIRISDNQKQGAGLAAAGAGIAYSTGRVAAGVLQEAARTENAARDMGRSARSMVDSKIKLKAGEKALRTMTKSRQLVSGAFKLHDAGTLVGAALIGAGVHRALSDTKLKDSPTAQAAVASGAGIAAHFALRTGYHSKLTRAGFSAIRTAARKAFLKV